MEKRLLIAFLLSMAVLFAYGLLFPQPKPVQPTPETTQTEAQQTTPATAETDVPAQTVTHAEPDGRTVSVTLPERETVVETGLYRAVISSYGGVIKSWKLLKYTDKDGNPLEMSYYDGAVRPLLVVPDGMTPEEAAAMNYSVEGVNDGTQLRLTYRDGEGRSIIKTLAFDKDTYAVGVDVSVSGFKGYSILTGEDFGSLTLKSEKGYGYTGPITYVDGELKDRGFVNWVKNIFRSSEEKNAPVKVFSGKEGWTGLTDKYFLAAIIPDGPIKAVVTKGVSDWGYTGIAVTAGEGAIHATLYAGPKEYDRLKVLGKNLQDSVGFGFFAFIAKPLFVALKFFHGILGNYGWAIVIITVIVKLLFAPLTHKQQKSMKRMAKLQPMVNELKEKYKGDAQRMNMEMMELYKREKVNPLGGCLPMVIQIPVFIALYNVLNNSIELRQAPFLLWIHDLSAKDPYYILPIAMGATMFITQKMTPSTADTAQQKVMMFLPVIFTFMFISLPSGLVLYFTLSNLLSMAQQFYINKTAEE